MHALWQVHALWPHAVMRHQPQWLMSSAWLPCGGGACVLQLPVVVSDVVLAFMVQERASPGHQI
jgi:hypothetical protein